MTVSQTIFEVEKTLNYSKLIEKYRTIRIDRISV